MSVLVYMDGVLRDSSKRPISQGIALYRSLKTKTTAVIACADSKDADRWLRENKLRDLDSLIDLNIPALGDDPEFRQFEYARAKGRVDLVITSNPELAKKLLAVGMTTIMFLHPHYLKEEFRPDSRKGIQSWADIVSELEKQQDSFSEDPRVSE